MIVLIDLKFKPYKLGYPQVRMVTGDNIMTAKAIALECGIFTEKGFAIEGKQFREMEKEEQYRIIPYLQVYSLTGVLEIF